MNEKKCCELRDNVLAELEITLKEINSGEILRLAHLIVGSGKVFVVGVGRVQLSLLAFCKRLNHLGISAFYVGEINEPRFEKNDLLIVGSRTGNTIIPLNIAQKAISLGGKIAYIGSNSNGFIAKNSVVYVQIPSYGINTVNEKFESHQIMTSLFEQILLLLGDIISSIIFELKELDINMVNHHHANLE